MLTGAFRVVVNKPFKEFFLHYFYRKYESFQKKINCFFFNFLIKSIYKYFLNHTLRLFVNFSHQNKSKN